MTATITNTNVDKDVVQLELSSIATGMQTSINGLYKTSVTQQFHF